MILVGLVLLFTTGLYTSCRNGGSESAPTGLMTDLLSEPDNAVITTPQPRFTWIPAGEEAMQTGYQIIVASSEEKLQNEEGDVWDSGKVDSGVSVSVPYGGNALNENSSYWWKV
ncbi:hypothetical protein, partial [uncultured Sunxiuqinia sp.]|uniref:glycoside hydrolase family 78 protein n=1 Tax=uncultured Sunxiuqinia sp. TaxID=1573825 RepID=UPI0030DC34FD